MAASSFYQRACTSPRWNQPNPNEVTVANHTCTSKLQYEIVFAERNYQSISKNFEETASSRFSQGYYFPQAKNYGSAPTWAWGFLGFKKQITELDGHMEGTL